MKSIKSQLHQSSESLPFNLHPDEYLNCGGALRDLSGHFPPKASSVSRSCSRRAIYSMRNDENLSYDAGNIRRAQFKSRNALDSQPGSLHTDLIRIALGPVSLEFTRSPIPSPLSGAVRYQVPEVQVTSPPVEPATTKPEHETVEKKKKIYGFMPGSVPKPHKICIKPSIRMDKLLVPRQKEVIFDLVAGPSSGPWALRNQEETREARNFHEYEAAKDRRRDAVCLKKEEWQSALIMLGLKNEEKSDSD